MIRPLDLTLILSVLSVPARSGFGQEAGIRVGPNVLVTRETGGRVLVEPHLAAHPTDPDFLLGVGWVTVDNEVAAGEGEHCAVVVSRDAGRTWARTDPGGRGCLDPWVSLTTRGTALLTSLGHHPDLPYSGLQLLAYFSSDSGATWSPIPQGLGGGHDGPRTLAAPDGTIFLLSGRAIRDPAGRLRMGPFVGRARPGGAYIEVQPQIIPSNLNQIADGMVILSDGALLITYTDFQRPVEGFMSRDGVLRTKRTWALRSTDAGASFSFPRLVTDACYARPTFLAVDRTAGPYRDRIYHVCDGDEERSVLFTFSADGGEEWQEPWPVEAPAAVRGSRTSPQVAVNSQGVVAVAWMDHRDDPTGPCYAPYFTVSGDGGRTFATPVRISGELSCPDRVRIGSPARRWREGGDYFGMAAGADGRFHLLWPDARSGMFELWSATVTVGVPGQS